MQFRFVVPGWYMAVIYLIIKRTHLRPFTVLLRENKMAEDLH